MKILNEPVCFALLCIRWNPSGNSNFNFQWTKTLYQNNLNDIGFFFTGLEINFFVREPAGD